MGFRAALALGTCLLLAGCGGGQGVTIINQTTTTVAPTGSGAAAVPTTTTVAPAGPGGAPATTATAPPAGHSASAGGSKRYSGPCGQPGVITGGRPATSGSPAVPGFIDLQADGTDCNFATQVAQGWIASWDPGCAPGCNRRIAAMRCQYAGAGSDVQCIDGDVTVRFSLAYPTA